MNASLVGSVEAGGWKLLSFGPPASWEQGTLDEDRERHGDPLRGKSTISVQTRRRQPLSRLDGLGTISACASSLGIPPLFRDRAAAGRALAEAIAELELELDEPVVIGVARGGVAVAVEVARELAAPLTAIDVERVNAHGLRLGRMRRSRAGSSRPD